MLEFRRKIIDFNVAAITIRVSKAVPPGGGRVGARARDQDCARRVRQRGRVTAESACGPSAQVCFFIVFCFLTTFNTQ